jgi:hypothetical protein
VVPLATNNKDFRVKNGLIVEGTTATVFGNDILTEASSIDDLVDVDASGAETGDTLVFDTSSNTWTAAAPGVGALSLDDLNDVDVSEVSDGQALVYSSGSNLWIPGAGGGGGGASFTISSTAPTSPSPGDVWYDSVNGNSYIYYNDEDSSQWVEFIGSAGPTGAIGEPGAPGEAGATGDPGKFITSSTPPEDPVNGDVWFNTTTGVILVYYIDEDSGQWVESGYPVFGPTISLEGLTDTNIPYPSDGDVLVYDSVSSKWVSGSSSTTGKSIAMSIIFG